MTTITKKSILTGKSDSQVAEIIKKGTVIKREGRRDAIEISDGTEVPISDKKHSIIKEFDGVRFRIPKKGEHMKWIEHKIAVQSINGEARTLENYWRFGLYVEAESGLEKDRERVTRTYRFKGRPDLSKNCLPFGEKVVGSVTICESLDTHTGKVTVIVNYYIHLSPVAVSCEVKIPAEKKTDTLFSHPIPRTNKFVVINKIG